MGSPLKSLIEAARPILSGLLLLSLLFSTLPVAAQTLSLPNRLQVRPGEIAFIEVQGDVLVRGLTAVHVTVAFPPLQPTDAPRLIPLIRDPSNPVEIGYGPLLPQPFSSAKVQSDQVGVAAAILNPNRAGYGPGLILSFPVYVPPQTPPGTTYAIYFLKAQAVGTGDQTMDTVTRMGSLVVNPNAPILGDVTGDGRVTVGDVIMILRITVGLSKPTDAQRYLADVFPHEGKINVADAVAALRRAVGLPIF